jgi:hypothetical protein
MATRAIRGTAPVAEAIERSRDVILRAANAPETRDPGRFGGLGHRIWAASFQLGLAGPSRPAYPESLALSVRDKALMESLRMGYTL